MQTSNPPFTCLVSISNCYLFTSREPVIFFLRNKKTFNRVYSSDLPWYKYNYMDLDNMIFIVMDGYFNISHLSWCTSVCIYKETRYWVTICIIMNVLYLWRHSLYSVSVTYKDVILFWLSLISRTANEQMVLLIQRDNYRLHTPIFFITKQTSREALLIDREEKTTIAYKHQIY